MFRLSRICKLSNMASGDHLGGLQEMMANVLQQMAHQMDNNDDSEQNEASRDDFYSEPQDSEVHNVTQQPNQEDTTNQQLTRTQESSVEYLTELWQDLQRLESTPTTGFNHARQVLMKEINRVWGDLCYQDMQYAGYPSNPSSDPGLWVPPAQNGPSHANSMPLMESPECIKLEETIAVPTEKYPNYNFIGRILGPRGMSVKQLEQETGCRILVRGKGSVRDGDRESRLIGKRGWEHLSTPLHISVSSSAYTRDAAQRILQQGVHCVKKLLCPAARDESKRRQLMELAIMNGNYRPVLYESYIPHV